MPKINKNTVKMKPILAGRLLLRVLICVFYYVGS